MNFTNRILSNKYRLNEKIAEGNSGDTYLATQLHSPQDAPVAIKILNGNGAFNRMEGIVEFTALTNTITKLNHQNIAKIFEIGEVLEFQYYIAKEYVEGESLDMLIGEKKFTFSESLDLIRQICIPLDYLHRKGIRHDALKPGNIIICGNRKSLPKQMPDNWVTTDYNIKLINCGMTVVQGFKKMNSWMEWLHTFSYISPEQSGIVKTAVDERSDLYSLGVIFYQLLTGNLPHTGEDVSSLVHRHIAESPVALRTINPEIPVILEKIVLKLLAKEPEQRYQTARGLLGDLAKYAQGKDNFTLEFPSRFSRPVFRSRLIGREKELQALKRYLHQAVEGRGSLCLVNGEIGSGKTRLLHEFREYTDAAGVLFLIVDCNKQEVNKPFASYVRLFNLYLEQYRGYPPLKKRKIVNSLESECKNGWADKNNKNPLMEGIFQESPLPDSVDLSNGNDDLRIIFNFFIRKLSELENGLAVAFDSLQWADDESLQLLTALPDSISAHPLLIIGTYRGEEIAAISGLRSPVSDAKNHACNTIVLERFDVWELNCFTAALLYEAEKDTREISSFIMKKSRGNPYFSIEILKSLIEAKVLYLNERRWDLDRMVLEDVEIPTSMVALLLERIGLFNEQERNIISCASVIGQEFNLVMLSEVGGYDLPQLEELAGKAVAFYLLEPSPEGKDAFQFVTFRIKEEFYNRIRIEKQKQCHLRIANILEKLPLKRSGKIVIDLANHFIRAGIREKSIEFAFPAACSLKDNHDNEMAIRYFEKAVDLLGGKSAPQGESVKDTWLKCMLGIGETYLLIGKFDDAINLYSEILPHVTTHLDKAEIYKQISQGYFKKGDFARCEKYGRDGLKLVGEFLPFGKFAVLYNILKETVCHAFHIMFPLLFVRSKENSEADRVRTIVWSYLFLTWSFVLSDVLKYTSSTLRMLNLAEKKIGPSKELGMVYSGYAMICACISYNSRATQYINKALELRYKLGDEWGIAQTYQILAFELSWNGKYEHSITCFEKSKKFFERIGDIRETGMCVSGILHNCILRSDYDKAKRLIEQYSRITYLTKDVYGISESLLYKTIYYFETGQIEKAESFGIKGYTDSLGKGVLFTHCIFCIELGRIYLEKEEVDKSLVYLENAKRVYNQNNFLKHYTIHLFNYLAEAYIADYAVRAKEMGARKRKQYLKKIKKCCNRAEKCTRNENWTSHRGGALLACANYNAIIGNKKNAASLFHQSIGHSEKIGRKYEQTRALYKYSLFLSQSGDTKKARSNFGAAYLVSSEIGAAFYVERIGEILGIWKNREALTPIEKFIHKERLVSVTKCITATSRVSGIDELINQLISKAMETTGARRGILFSCNGEKQPKLVYEKAFFGSEKEPYCAKVVTDVLNTGNPVLVADACKDPRYAHDESVRKFALKSILCIPVKAQEKTIAVCYIDNSLSGNVFNKNDLNILATFMSQMVVPLLQQDSAARNEKKPSITSFTEEKIRQAISYINDNYTSRKICRQNLADIVGINTDHMGKFFKHYTGKKVNDYINELRIKDAAGKLRKTNDNVIDIAFSVGFDSLATFNRTFLRIMDVTPSKYRGV